MWVWDNDHGGSQWLPTTVTGGVATAKTGHFSGGFLAAVDPGALTKSVFTHIGNFVTGRSGATNPTCHGETAVRKPLKVESDTGDAVKWCLGQDASGPVLKVTNNLRTWAQVSGPRQSR